MTDPPPASTSAQAGSPRRLRAIGLQPRQDRSTVLCTLAGELPAAILAQPLGTASTLPSPGLRPRRLWSRRPAGWQSPAFLGVLAANSVAAEQFGDLAAGRFEVVGREGDLRRGRTGLDQGADGRDPVWAGVVPGPFPAADLGPVQGGAVPAGVARFDVGRALR
jgi:hypothetical protein